MEKKIIVNFPLTLSENYKNLVSEHVNFILRTIVNEVDSWNGFVDLHLHDDGKSEFIAQCDNDELRDTMQTLLDAHNEELQSISGKNNFAEVA